MTKTERSAADMKSINQIAQETGDTSANEAFRIRERESLVKTCWRTIAYNEGEVACTAERVATATGFSVEFVCNICGTNGYHLQ